MVNTRRGAANRSRGRVPDVEQTAFQDMGAQRTAPSYSTEFAAVITQAVTAGVTASLRNLPQAPQASIEVVPPVLEAPAEQDFVWELIRNIFVKGNPPEFVGATNITVAYQWRKDIEKHLRMIECTEVQKQLLATLKLVGDALQWWESVTTIV